MTILVFDKDNLARVLHDATPIGRVAFAAACSERLFGLYRLQERFPGEHRAAREALDWIWQAVMAGKFGIRHSYLDCYDQWIRGEDAPWSPLGAFADNSIAAIAYACECCETTEVAPAVWAAVQGYGAADFMAHTLENVDFDQEDAEDRIVRSQWVQTELAAQQGDIELSTRPVVTSVQLTGLRDRARAQAEALNQTGAALRER